MTQPFHSAEVDEVDVVGVMFDGSTGQFYEFQDPETHDDRERYEDPRSGDVIVYGSRVERMMGDILNGRPRATVPVDEWSDFRDDYVSAPTEDYDSWSEKWKAMAEADPRFDGGVEA